MLPSDRLQAALWIGLGLVFLWLLARLSPILSPFILAAVLAYICNPLVDRLERHGVPRLAGVLAMLALIGGIVATLILILLPLLAEETGIVAERLPEVVALINEKLLPWLRQHYGIRIRLDAEFLRRLATDNWGSVQAIVQKLLESLKIGGVALFGVVANLLLTPVVMFYLLMDWHRLLERIENALPRAWHARTTQMAADVDAVLAEFLRGQIMVMLILAVYYSVALWLADLPSALPVGLLTGLLIFVPYLGFATGLTLALLVAVLQFQGLAPIMAVLVVYGLGQLFESFLLTPFLVGERIGLHPLAVIFALMAFGQLFGFVGVLIALPASAALLVGLREMRALYLGSRFYQGPA
ncbi:MAG: AI-2E family transporter [Rhodocyclaceae bacterium]|nr:AI-2E family transporter [Rhodocyclaceae bacterium]